MIRTVEVELESKIADLKTKLDFETKARDSNLRRLEERRKKLAEMLGAPEPPSPLSDAELARHNLPDVEFKSGLRPFCHVLPEVCQEPCAAISSRVLRPCSLGHSANSRLYIFSYRAGNARLYGFTFPCACQTCVSCSADIKGKKTVIALAH